MRRPRFILLKRVPAAAAVAIIPLHRRVVTWALKKDSVYAARTDEHTSAQYFRPQ